MDPATSTLRTLRENARIALQRPIALLCVLTLPNPFCKLRKHIAPRAAHTTASFNNSHYGTPDIFRKRHCFPVGLKRGHGIKVRTLCIAVILKIDSEFERILRAKCTLNSTVEGRGSLFMSSTIHWCLSTCLTLVSLASIQSGYIEVAISSYKTEMQVFGSSRKPSSW